MKILCLSLLLLCVLPTLNYDFGPVLQQLTPKIRSLKWTPGLNPKFVNMSL